MTAFLDSNILVYTVSDRDRRQDQAIAIVTGDVMVSVQVLNEFASVARRKLQMSWRDVDDALRSLRAVLPPPLPITLALHTDAMALASRYDFSFYDALIVAAAREASCDTLLSEDMQDGMRVEGGLVIRNPFV